MSRYPVALFFSCILSIPGFGQTARETTMTGKIIDATTHQPIAGAQISYDSSGSSGKAAANADGAYSFPVSTPGMVVFDSISMPGYATLGLGFGSGILGMVVELKPGASETRDFEMSRAAGLYGRLVDRDSGDPIPGFYVQAIRRGVARHNPGGIQSAPSGTDGSFVIANLAPGDYSLEADPPMGGKIVFGDKKTGDERTENVGYGPTWFPGVPRADMAAPVTLAAGENRAVEMRIQKRELRHIAGSVQAPEGMEGVGIWIDVRTVDGPTVTSGEIPKAGPFRVAGLEDGSYRILASTKTSAGHDRTFDGRRVELASRSVEDLKLVLRPAVTLRAVVTMAEEKADIPAGMGFFVLPLDGWGPGAGTTVSDRMQVTQLPPGMYCPFLTIPSGYAVASVSYNGQPALNTPIDVQAPESAVTYTLTARPARVTGFVRDAEQKPVPNAIVVLFPEAPPNPTEDLDGQAQRFFLGFTGKRTNSGGNGGFLLKDVAPGRYYALALAGGDVEHAMNAVFLRSQARSSEALVLEAGQTASLDVHLVR